MNRAAVGLALLIGMTVSANGQSILIFDDNTNNHRAQGGVTSLGLSYTVANASNFDTLLGSQSWNLVIIDAPSTLPNFTNFTNYVIGGGKAIVSTYVWGSATTMATAMGVSANGNILSPPPSIFRWDISSSVFNTPNAIGDLTSWSNEWVVDGQKLNVLAGTALAGLTASPAAGEASIVVGNGGNTIANGFLFDELNDPTGTHLVANEVQFLLSAVPEPGTIALCGVALAGTGYAAWRRRLRAKAILDGKRI